MGIARDRWVGQTVLVTGGTGFMGSLLIEKLLDYGVEYVISFSRRWNDSELLEKRLDDRRLICVNGDVRDRKAIDDVMRRYHPDSVIHAAAYKSVPSAEANPNEVISVNLIGTMNVVDSALEHGVDELCFISTDKACAGINTYGKSKALAEAYVSGKAMTHDLYRNPRYFSCRYGNVVGSTGSVFGVFKDAEQFNITVPDMTRFWFRKNSAAEFVLDSFDRAMGGEVFVPYLHSSTMQVFAEAWQVIFDKQIVVTGIRPGEKLHEKMISDDEMPATIWLKEPNVFAILPHGYSVNWSDSVKKAEEVVGSEFTSKSTERYTKKELVKLIEEYLHGK
jgi:UDP-N-acetylglucosamine 4,6-dehydratase